MSTVAPAELEIVRRAVARLRAAILALVFAGVGSTGTAVATAWLLIRGGDEIGPHLGLLAVYLPGYSVTWHGVVVGFIYGALIGAVLGASTAIIYNRIAFLRGHRHAADDDPARGAP